MTAGRNVWSQSQEWGTPQHYVEAVREVFGGQIALDPCSNCHSLVDAETEYMLPDSDGLHESWEFPTIYVNPPYGTDKVRRTRISDWLARCSNAHHSFGSEVIALVPVATNTGHWKKWVWPAAAAVCFLYDTRLKFLEDGKRGGKGAPMSCCMIYWGGQIGRFFEVFCRFGAVVDLRPLHGQQLGYGPKSSQSTLFSRSK